MASIQGQNEEQASCQLFPGQSMKSTRLSANVWCLFPGAWLLGASLSRLFISYISCLQTHVACQDNSWPGEAVAVLTVED